MTRCGEFIGGGGDLYAYEFLPGLGGSKDVLAAGVAPNSFAIVPQINGYGPVDTQYYLGSNIVPGDAVYLSGIPGELPAGTYAILPARYALLPGAFLVTAVNGTSLDDPTVGNTIFGTLSTSPDAHVTVMRDGRQMDLVINMAQAVAEAERLGTDRTTPAAVPGPTDPTVPPP